jgi:hypothetical protein
MNKPAESMPRSAYVALEGACYRPSALTRGPWHPDHQHAGPPIALMCRAIENAALNVGFTHISRLTANLLRPVPIRDLTSPWGNGFVSMREPVSAPMAVASPNRCSTTFIALSAGPRRTSRSVRATQ